MYQDIKQRMLTQHDVFRDEITSCTSEHARYVLPVVPTERNLVTNEFAHDACGLPLAYDATSHKSFIDRWGTVGIVSCVKHQSSFINKKSAP